MTRREYADFDLLVVPSSSGGYRARLLAAPSGEVPATSFEIPFSDLEIENFLLKIGRRRGHVRAARTSSEEARAIQDFGSRLFRAVFHDDLRVALASSLDQAEGRGAGLRVRLRLSEAPELADLPWEYLYDKDAGHFLALSEWTPVIRYLEFPGRIRPLTVTPPLRILVHVAGPSDFPTLDADAEWLRMREALDSLVRDGRVELTRVPSGTLRDLQRTLRQNEFHAFHYIGHGGFDTDGDDGVLVLEDADGRGQLISGQDLGMVLHDHRTLRLAVLNSCEGARGGRSDPFSGTAQSLVRQRIPAVVAMQFEISDHAAVTFSQCLYEALADGYPVDAAMAEARKAVRGEPNPIEWGTPVLYMRAPDGRLFDIEPAKRTPSVGAAEPDPEPTSALSPEAPPVPPAPDRPPGAVRPRPTGRQPASGLDDRAQERGPEARAEEPSGTPPAPADPRPSPGQPHSGPEAPGAPGPRFVRARDAVFSVSIDGATELLATAGGQWVQVWHTADGRPLWELGTAVRFGARIMGFLNQVFVRGVALRPGVPQVAVATTDRAARLWDLRTGRTVLEVFHDAAVHAVAFSAEGDVLATGSEDGTARTWDSESGDAGVRVGHPAPVLAVALSRDGLLLASASVDRTSRVWSAADGTCAVEVRHDAPVLAVELSPDGSLLATASADRTARLWDVASGQQILRLEHQPAVHDVRITADGRRIATGSADRTARIWDAESGRELSRLNHESEVQAITFDPDGSTLVMAGTSRTARFVDFSDL